MGVFADATANLPTQLWIQARFVEAFSLFLIPLLVRRRIQVSIPLLGYACATLCLLGITFATDLFPVCYAEGEGLTPFKKGSEYVICLVPKSLIIRVKSSILTHYESIDPKRTDANSKPARGHNSLSS